MTTDPELYLRLLGEQMVTDTDRTDVGLIPVASAFVAAGALELSAARSVVRDYALAAELRGFGHGGYADPEPSRPPTRAPQAPRVAWVHMDDSEDHGFRYAILSDQHAEVTFSYTGNADWEQVAKNFPKPQGFPNSLLLEDDRGKGQTAHRSSQQMGGPWTGSFATQAPLFKNTSYLDIGGRRMKLLAADPPPAVSVHDIGVDRLPASYLRHLAALTLRDHAPLGGHVDRVAEAFRDCALVAADDPVLADIAAITALPLGGPPSVALPERWASLSRGTLPGRAGTLLLGAATPLIGDASVTVIALDSKREEFIIDTWQFGGTSPMSLNFVVPAPPIVWWAQDDLGGWYLGAWQGSMGGNDVECRGQVRYSPALDPRATRLSVMPTALSSYATIDIDLTGTWRPLS